MRASVDSKRSTMTFRRKTWADWISLALVSHPKKKITLNEMYAWMIRNVPVCQNTPNMKSSEGWKNSIRHTLSVQPQFVRLLDRGDRGCYWTHADNNLNDDIISVSIR